MELEQKLAEYKARKRKSLLVKKVKHSVSDVLSRICGTGDRKMNSQENVTIIDDDCDGENDSAQLLDESVAGSSTPETIEEFHFNWQKFSLYVILWCSLFGLAVFAEFGAVYVILSGFVLIWVNTRTSARRPGEISAYSVFNPNCEAIQGTLDAKQLEQQMIFGGM